MRNLGGIGGVLFAVGIIVAFAIAGDGPPEDAKGAENYYEDFRGVAVYAGFTLAVAGLVWFASALHKVLGSVTTTATIIASGALVFAASSLLIGLGETASELKDFSYDTSLIDVFETTSYFLITSAHALLGIGAIAAGFAMRRSDTLPAWLSFASIIVGVIGLASPAFFPMMLIWVWASVTGVVLLLRPLPAPVAD